MAWNSSCKPCHAISTWDRRLLADIIITNSVSGNVRTFYECTLIAHCPRRKRHWAVDPGNIPCRTMIDEYRTISVSRNRNNMPALKQHRAFALNPRVQELLPLVRDAKGPIPLQLGDVLAQNRAVAVDRTSGSAEMEVSVTKLWDDTKWHSSRSSLQAGGFPTSARDSHQEVKDSRGTTARGSLRLTLCRGSQ